MWLVFSCAERQGKQRKRSKRGGFGREKRRKSVQCVVTWHIYINTRCPSRRFGENQALTVNATFAANKIPSKLGRQQGDLGGSSSSVRLGLVQNPVRQTVCPRQLEIRPLLAADTKEKLLKRHERVSRKSEQVETVTAARQQW
jgi:hypothetical protein